jgi:LysR family hydrogen peroxide-inducible transcriptional activator
MNITRLKYFIELARSRNFSRAAERLNISQPALSLQIQKLEDEFEFRLIDRTKKPLSLTEEGKLFLSRSLKIIQLVDDLGQLSTEIEDRIEGTLRVGIIPTLSPYLIPVFMDTLNKQYPGLFLDVAELKTEEIISRLNYSELDLGILSTPVVARNIEFKPLFYELFFLYVSGKNKLSGQDKVSLTNLPTDELWYLREGNCFQNQVNSICKIPESHETDLPFRYSSYSIESLKRIVEFQGGMTFIPELATMNIPSDNEDMIKAIEDPAPVREISAAYLKATGLKKTARILLDVLLSRIPPRMKQKPEIKPLNTMLQL